MIIGERLRKLREAKGLSQGDIEKCTGLIRCYTSRVENGHTIPGIDTLEKYANVLEIPLYKIFYDGDASPRDPKVPAAKSKAEWGEKGKERDELKRFAKLLARLNERQRQILLKMALQMADRPKDGNSNRRS